MAGTYLASGYPTASGVLVAVVVLLCPIVVGWIAGISFLRAEPLSYWNIGILLLSGFVLAYHVLPLRPPDNRETSTLIHYAAVHGSLLAVPLVFVSESIKRHWWRKR